MLTRPQGSLRLAPPDVVVEHRPDGSMVLRSPHALGPVARTPGDWLVRWAADAPQRVFLAERDGTGWRTLRYGEALAQVRRVGQGLLDRGLGPDAPLMILSDNSIDHALLMFGALHVGVPVVPVSPAYSLLSRDHAKLRQICELVRPGLVHTSDPARYSEALAAIGHGSVDAAELMVRPATAAVDAANARITSQTLAKVLFTSGSTGAPKGVINTHGMLTTNQQQSRQVWPFLDDEPPVVVDWLPWNHTFGGNYNLNMVLSNGGTMYIDGGKPAPGLIETTVRNLREIAPTMYFNVPRGFDLLLPFLEQDAALCRHFFSRCAFVFYAGAALPQNLWTRFQALARRERGSNFALVSAWGSTETAPLCAALHFPVEGTGVIGLPVPGCDIKLLPNAGKLEARVKGPNVTPGYFRRDDLTAQAFDEEGYYRMGDAIRFVEAGLPQRGLIFDGRVAEDFKLRSGTWVHVGALRVQLLTVCDPLVQDAVITGHDRDEIGALLFLNPGTTRGLDRAEVAQHIAGGLARLAEQNAGSSSYRVARARVLDDPPQVDAGEITDKGYINQRAVLQARAAEVLKLHEPQPGDGVIFPA
jgi:feruloyl-CoA synthase